MLLSITVCAPANVARVAPNLGSPSRLSLGPRLRSSRRDLPYGSHSRPPRRPKEARSPYGHSDKNPENNGLAPMLLSITECVSPDLRNRLQGHGYVPLNEIFLTAPNRGRPGNTRNRALLTGIAFRSRKQRTSVYAT